jgi:voltage-gated potassium channel
MTAPTRFSRLRTRLRILYQGESPAAERFQLLVLAVDLAIIAFFIATPLLRDGPVFYWVDAAIAFVLSLDLIARGIAARHTGRWLRQPTTMLDFIVLLTLLFPLVLANLGFLRILRLFTLNRSGALWRPFERAKKYRVKDIGQAAVNLATFLLLLSGFVLTFFGAPSGPINGYIDALYFTVTTVTTTGYGDVTLPGPLGRLTSIAAMIVGIALFVRLAQSLFRPDKVYFPCPDCGLNRHDPDAVHCKACGVVLNIPDEGL